MIAYSNTRDQYLENEILSAGPVKRIQLLYGGAIQAIEKARVALAERQISSRTAHVNRALDILTELALSLDHSRGVGLTRELAEVYDYLQRRLLEGNATQQDAPFAEAERLLKTVLEGWKSIPEVEHGFGTGDMRLDHDSGPHPDYQEDWREAGSLNRLG